MQECLSCNVSFTLTFDNEADAELNYCPHCGEGFIRELDLNNYNDLGEENEED